MSWRVSSNFVSGSGVCMLPLEALSLPRGAAPTRSRTAAKAMGGFSSSAHQGRAALMLEEIGAMVAGVGPLPQDGLAGVYNRHDTTLVPPLAAEHDEPDINKP